MYDIYYVIVQNSNNLPNDPEELKKLLMEAQIENLLQVTVIHNQKKEIDLKVKKLADQESLIIRLNEMLSNLRRSHMGVKSEKTDLKDYYENGLFNEAELGLHDEATLYEDHAEEIEIKGHTRRSRGRRRSSPKVPKICSRSYYRMWGQMRSLRKGRKRARSRRAKRL